MARNIDVDAEINSVRLIEQESAPEPDAGYSHIYAKANGLYIVDDDDAVTGPFVMAQDIGCRVYHDTVFDVPNASTTALPFNTERWDTDGIHNTITNNDRLTCQTAGKYLIVGNVRLANSAVGIRVLGIYLNASTMIGRMSINVLAAGDNITLNVSTIYSLSVTDYVTLRVYQNTGGNLSTLLIPNAAPEFMMQKVG